MCPANERWRYILYASLIGWVHIQKDPCIWDSNMVFHKCGNCADKIPSWFLIYESSLSRLVKITILVVNYGISNTVVLEIP